VQSELILKKDHHVGAKCFFLTMHHELLAIREPEKRLDLIGGLLDPGETPVAALCREVREETTVMMKEEDFLYLGITEEMSDTGLWTSHVFFAIAPPEMAKKKYVETFMFSQLAEFAQSGAGRPRQVWMARHLAFICDLVPNYNEALNMAAMVWKIQPVVKMTPSDRIIQLTRDKYVQRLRVKYLEYSECVAKVSLSLGSFKRWLESMKYYVGHGLPEIVWDEFDSPQQGSIPTNRAERYSLFKRVFQKNDYDFLYETSLLKRLQELVPMTKPEAKDQINQAILDMIISVEVVSLHVENTGAKKYRIILKERIFKS